MILVDEGVGSMASVDYVFKVLAAAYGAAWDRSLGAAPLGDVMTVWANAMDGFTQTAQARKAISWALNNLPDRCPNAMEFRRLCHQAPSPEAPRLPEPKADPERVRAELAKLAPLRQQVQATAYSCDAKAWARRIVASHQAGDKVNRAALQMARTALRMDAHA